MLTGLLFDLVAVPVLAAVDWKVERRQYWRAVRAAENEFRLGDAGSMAKLLRAVAPYGILTDDDFYSHMAQCLTERIGIAGSPRRPTEMRELIEQCAAIVTAQEAIYYVSERRAINLLARFLSHEASGSRVTSV